MTVPSRAVGVESSRFGPELLVLDAEGRMVRGLNATGARIFELVDGNRTEEQIAQAIVSEFQVDLARARVDVRAFLGVLAAKSLIRLEERPKPEGRGVGP